MCASAMGTLWHRWSPVLISLAALFSKESSQSSLTLWLCHFGHMAAGDERARGFCGMHLRSRFGNGFIALTSH
ncbi:hypothetical protein E5288_WYG018495 [Bos mutus]|uniref:Secreted protein n=1 Tax=Bos mutus TaxID=72004 RepID=A0A6B0RV61_9CETA|nr:hypothetical protein [Bos mutus]